MGKKYPKFPTRISARAGTGSWGWKHTGDLNEACIWGQIVKWCLVSFHKVIVRKSDHQQSAVWCPAPPVSSPIATAMSVVLRKSALNVEQEMCTWSRARKGRLKRQNVLQLHSRLCSQKTPLTSLERAAPDKETETSSGRTGTIQVSPDPIRTDGQMLKIDLFQYTHTHKDYPTRNTAVSWFSSDSLTLI